MAKWGFFGVFSENVSKKNWLAILADYERKGAGGWGDLFLVLKIFIKKERHTPVGVLS